MRKNYFLIFIFIGVVGYLGAQAPVMNPIAGPSAFCSPATGITFTASASNSPTAFSWTIVPAPVSMSAGGVNNQFLTVNFQPVNGTYTIYCVASNAFGSSAVMTKVVNVYETPNVTFSGATSFCQGSSTSLSASSTMMSASSTINYFWSPPTGLNTTFGPNVMASPTTNMTYTVQAYNGPCSASNTIAVTVNPNPTVSITNPNPSVCAGSTASLIASGASTYTWSNGVPNGSPFIPPYTQSYFVTGANSFGCTHTVFTGIVVHPLPSFTISSSPSLACMGQTVMITMYGSSTYTFNGTPLSGNSVVVSPTVNTTYTISGTTSQGCVGSTAYTQYVGCVGIMDPGSPDYAGMKAFPNPNAGEFTLRSGFDEQVKLYNELGQLIKEFEIRAGEQVKMSNLRPGVYFVNSERIRIKLIVVE